MLTLTHAGHLSLWGKAAIITGAAAGVGLLISWYWREARKLLHRWRRAQWTREWHERLAAVADRPFDLHALTRGERERLIGASGVNSRQWALAWAADLIAGRRDAPPTFGDYLAEFGHPRTR